VCVICFGMNDRFKDRKGLPAEPARDREEV